MAAFSPWDALSPFALSRLFLFLLPHSLSWRIHSLFLNNLFSALKDLISDLRRISSSCSDSLCLPGWVCLCFFIWDSFGFRFFLRSIRPIYPISLYLWTQIYNLAGASPAEMAAEVKDSPDKTQLTNSNRSFVVQTLFRFLCFSAGKPSASAVLHHQWEALACSQKYRLGL